MIHHYVQQKIITKALKQQVQIEGEDKTHGWLFLKA